MFSVTAYVLFSLRIIWLKAKDKKQTNKQTNRKPESRTEVKTKTRLELRLLVPTEKGVYFVSITLYF